MFGSQARRAALIAAVAAIAALAAGGTAVADEGPLPEVGTLDTVGHATTLVHDRDAAGRRPSGQAGRSGSASATFSAPAYVAYDSRGGEPSNAVDRYPFTGVQCPAGHSPCFKDLVYASAPEGLPGFSFFWKSDDLGGTFRAPRHLPSMGNDPGQGIGGGDSHQAIGEKTHDVFFIDLPGDCVTVNTSTDLGESFTTDPLGCGLEPGTIDDRQWIDTDEGYPGSQNVYVSFIDETTGTLALARSQQDGAKGTFATDSVCNTLSANETAPADNPTACPDPSDPDLNVAGPVVADKAGDHSGSHIIYIPFIRTTGDGDTRDDQLWIARSTDGADTWTRLRVADLGHHAADNIFPQLAIDRGGNLYYTWAQTQDGIGGETDVYYAYSTDHGAHWSKAIDLTGERGDSAVFPWLVAGDAGRVDLVYYRANTGINPNAFGTGAKGQECDPSADPGCKANASVWNVEMAQSLNALNGGKDFRTIQISDRPNHFGQICTSGTGCSDNGGNRNLLDFFTVDIDHLGAANIVWADDNNSLNFTRNLGARQLSGSSLYRDAKIHLRDDWPVGDHGAGDRAGDVISATSQPAGACPGMDLLGSAAQTTDKSATFTLTLDAAPTSAAASACGGPGATGGLWGAEFWAPSATDPDDPGAPNDNFYAAYVDDPSDGQGPHVEAGRLNNFNATLQKWDFHSEQRGTFGGTCITRPTATPCTLTVTTSLASLGIKPGAGLFSVTGLATYKAGTTSRDPAGVLRVSQGNTELGDAVTPFTVDGRNG